MANTKLKQLLEGFAWERNPDGSLPTIQDAINIHQKNINEAVNMVKAGAASGEYVITVQHVPNTSVLFIPKMKTLDQLRNLDLAQIQDELIAFCESKTGLKFSANTKYQGAGYAFEIDMYSIIEKIKN